MGICRECGNSDNFYKTQVSYCKNCFKQYMNKYKKDTNWKKYYQTSKGRYKVYESRAKKSSFIFSIDFDFFNSLISKDCFYCGVSPSKELIGVDRVDNSKGYSFDNCVPCCSNCNYSKRGRSDIDFIEHCKRVTLYQLTKTNPFVGVS